SIPLHLLPVLSDCQTRALKTFVLITMHSHGATVPESCASSARGAGFALRIKSRISVQGVHHMSRSTSSMVSDSRSGDARSAIREVKEDVRQLKQDVSQAASAAAHSGMEAIRSGASQVSDRGRRVAEAAKDT